MRHPSEIDDLHLEHARPDDSWLPGEIDLAQERPATTLRSDPSHRKWMLLGLGGCGLFTALAVLFLTHDAKQARAADQPAVEPAPIEQRVEPAKPPPEPVPAVAEPKPREQPTLAATSRAAAIDPQPINKAPPVPTAPLADLPVDQPASPATAPAVPSSPAAKPTPAPAANPPLPAEEPSKAERASELPDVEAWDDADAAAGQGASADEPVG